MIDPVLKGVDMPLLVDAPLKTEDVPKVDAPDMDPFNGDPAELKARILNPDRALVLAPGEPFTLKRSHRL